MFRSELEFKAQCLCSQAVLGTSVNTATPCNVTDPVPSTPAVVDTHSVKSFKRDYFQTLWACDPAYSHIADSAAPESSQVTCLEKLFWEGKLIVWGTLCKCICIK